MTNWTNQETVTAYNWLAQDEYAARNARDAADHNRMREFLSELLFADQPTNGLALNLLDTALANMDTDQLTRAFRTTE